MFRFRPVDGAFYDLFGEAADHLVAGAALLAEMFSESADRADVAARMREAEHAADETTHAIVLRVNSTFVTPFDREDIYTLATQPRRRDGPDGRGRRPDLSLRPRQRPGRGQPPGRGAPALRRADCRGDAGAAQPAGPRGLLDRDQPPRERRRQGLPADPREAVQRRATRRCEVLKLKDIVECLERAIDAFERSPTPSSRSRSRSPDAMELAIIIAVVVVALVVRLHQRLP